MKKIFQFNSFMKYAFFFKFAILARRSRNTKELPNLFNPSSSYFSAVCYDRPTFMLICSVLYDLELDRVKTFNREEGENMLFTNILNIICSRKEQRETAVEHDVTFPINK